MPFFRTPIKCGKKQKKNKNSTKKQKIGKHNNARNKSNNNNGNNGNNQNNYNENNDNENNDNNKSDPYLRRVNEVVVDNFNSIDKNRIIVRYIGDDIEIIIDGCEEEYLLRTRWYPYAIIKNILNDDTELHIETLTSCAPLSGSVILNSFIEIARDLGLKYVTLDDASTVYFGGKYGEDKCAASLAILDILVGGRSWYYHMGFSNDNNDEWLAHNIKVALFTKFKEFIELIVTKEVRQKISGSGLQKLAKMPTLQMRMELNKRIQPVLDSMYEEIARNFPDINLEEDIVSNAIYKMIQSIRAEKTCPPRLKILQRIVRSSEIKNHNSDMPVIKYDPNDLILVL
jgi:hypothetical protein